MNADFLAKPQYHVYTLKTFSPFLFFTKLQFYSNSSSFFTEPNVEIIFVLLHFTCAPSIIKCQMSIVKSFRSVAC